MARGGITTAYPDPRSIARTLRKHATLHATREFFAGEGDLIFANTIDVMQAAADDVWLRPSAYRRLTQFLDLKTTPTIVGYTLIRTAAHLEGTVPESLFDDFVEVAEARTGLVVEKPREIRLGGVSDDPYGGWPWHGTIIYRNVYTLDGGQRIHDDVRVPIIARPGPERDEVDVAIITWGRYDQEAAFEWLRQITVDAQGARGGGWYPDAVLLDDDAEKRLEALKAILTELAGGQGIRLRSPDMKGRGSRKDVFSGLIRNAPYRTWMTDTLDLIGERMREDESIISSIEGFAAIKDVTVADGSTKSHPVVCLRVHQPHQSSENAQKPLRLTWVAGRKATVNEIDAFSDEVWEYRLRPIEWTGDEKSRFLGRAWAHLLDTLRSDATGASRVAASA